MGEDGASQHLSGVTVHGSKDHKPMGHPLRVEIRQDQDKRQILTPWRRPHHGSQIL